MEGGKTKMEEGETKMEEGSEFRQWDDLIPDALGLIFKKLPLEGILTVIPRVCKAWGKAVQGPYCWQEINIDEWSKNCEAKKLDRMLRLLITRSSGSLRKLHVSCVNDNKSFVFIAENAGSLQNIILQRSDVSDSIVEQFAGKFSRVTSLDLSYCCQISTRALEAIGKNCKLLSSLSWNMHPSGSAFKPSHADEAHAIARTMPKLKQLELAYLRINTECVLDILSGCPNLEFVDLRGCWDVHLDKRVLEKWHPKLEVLGPQVEMGVLERRANFYDDYYDSDFPDYNYMDYSDDDSFDGMWDDEDIELSIYEADYDMYDEFGWPSP